MAASKPIDPSTFRPPGEEERMTAEERAYRAEVRKRGRRLAKREFVVMCENPLSMFGTIHQPLETFKAPAGMLDNPLNVLQLERAIEAGFVE